MSEYGSCEYCNESLEPVWFVEEEYKMYYGEYQKTGRKIRKMDYLICPKCLREYCVDDSFDEYV